MDEIGFLIVIVLVALAAPIMGVVAFVRTGGLRRRVAGLEAKLAEVHRDLSDLQRSRGLAAEEPLRGPQAQAPEPSTTEEPAAEPAEPEPQSTPIEPEPVEAMQAAPPEPVPQAARASLEETLGTRWAVWLGGIALGLGGLFLVRYSIEQGYFGPVARVFAGALFALALLVAGEWLRRREVAGAGPLSAFGTIPSAHIPSILTAAGTVTAFGTVYAAHALYALIGPFLAFILLGAIGLGTMALAALHGPALAGLGLLASFVAPLLVGSEEPSAWPVVPYLAVITAAAYGLARLRRWQWLARAAAAGAAVWAVAFIAGSPDEALPAMVHIGVQMLLASGFLIVDAYRDEAARNAGPDPLASAILAAFALLAVAATHMGWLPTARPVFAGAVIALLLAIALRYGPGAAGAVLAPIVAAGTLAFWPIASEIAREGRNVLPGLVGPVPMPEALLVFLAFAGIAALATLAVGLLRLARGGALDPIASIVLAAGAAAGPLLVLTVAWWRVTLFDTSVPFAVAAGILALAFTSATVALQRAAGDEKAAFSHLAGIEAFAAAALGSLALGLTMVLDRGSLTVALALTAMAAAWITTRSPLGLLRWAVGALGIVVLARLIREPTVVADVGTTPIFNWLLWGYGVPAVAFGLSARLLSTREDAVPQICRGLAIVFSGLLVFLQIRHLISGGDIYASGTEHLEAGLDAFASLLFAIVLTRLEAVRRNPLYRIALYVFGALGLGFAVGGLLFFANPLVTNEEIVGGAVLNSLLLAYLLAAFAAFGLALMSRGHRPAWFVTLAGALGILLQLLWTVAEIRNLFQGPRIGIWQATSDAELYTYSAAILVTGLVLLALGVWRHSRLLRLASGLYLLLAVGKVFLVDMSGLTGPLRALSFIGLGLVLVGIGLVYQKLVFARPAGTSDAPAQTPN
jgi:uncharacterized membrane protein